MFGCVVAGRLLQTELRQIDETHAAFELPSAEQINHVCVFLLGNIPFPEGYGASVHLFWPGKGFQFLGMLSNEKPSAIFRLRGAYTAQSTNTHAGSVFSGASTPTGTTESVTAILGIAIEPLTAIQQQMATLPSSMNASVSAVVTRSNTPSIGGGAAGDATVLAEKVVKHLFNYLSSFAQSASAMTPETPIPMAMILKWYENFVAKLRAGGAGFLDNQ
ncbi:hypothetical protein QCA50_013436 [Cerrena zonata]|uniref:Hikeshi-like domain-containing protein n=1 Tax=Cerrena zonata TaxID=2478898 RepID=A0AAW0G109_9APHY